MIVLPLMSKNELVVPKNAVVKGHKKHNGLDGMREVLGENFLPQVLFL